jgi:16S rRNA (adenine1518-N6/adenine1519-N6)-dimethyltransferase
MEVDVPGRKRANCPLMSERTRISALLREHDIRLSHRMGQHFLADLGVLTRIAQAVGAGPDCEVVEIGAGIGNLSAMLARTGADVTAVELDRRFVPIHEKVGALNGPGRISFHYGDALDFDFAAAATHAAARGRKLLVAGNIPYQITSPLVMRVLESGADFAGMTLMMQREVAVRLAAGPGSRRNGSISIKVQFYCGVQARFDVPPSAFLPPPKVHSCVVSFTRHEAPLDDARRARFFGLVESGFGQRRKMLPNSVAAKGHYSKEAVEAALVKMGLDPSVRAESLGLREFLALFAELDG